MGYQALIVEKRNRVGVITLNRPEVRNALNAILMEEMIDALQKFDEDPGVAVIIITGAGTTFCSGHDFSELHGRSLADFRRTFGKSVQVLQTIAAISKVVIAAVNGYATAMGCGLAAGCDLVIASAGAKFQTPGVNGGFGCVTPMAVLGVASITPAFTLSGVILAPFIGILAVRFGVSYGYRGIYRRENNR